MLYEVITPLLFADAQCFLHPEFAIGVHNPFNVGGVDGLSIVHDLNLGFRIRNLLDAYEDLHLHPFVIRTTTALGWNPGNYIVRILYIAALAMQAVA